jgi:DNA-binding SARP family transcriptional activator
MERDGEQPPLSAVQAWIERASAMGLLGTADVTGEPVLHPLLGEFLSREFDGAYTPAEVSAIHRRVGRAAGVDDWLPATKHLVLGGDKGGAAEIIERAAVGIVGTGQSVRAATHLRSFGVPIRPAAAVLVARDALERGAPYGALALLDGIEIEHLDPDVRALVRGTLIQVGWWTGDEDLLRRAIDGTCADSESPEVYRGIAEVWQLLWTVDFDLREAAIRLRTLAGQQSDLGLHFYAAISLHNAALLLNVAGEHRESHDIGMASLSEFDRLPVPRRERRSRLSALAVVSTELGRAAEGDEFAAAAVAPGGVDADAVAEVALLAVATGDIVRATRLLLSHQPRVPQQVGESRTFARARARLAIVDGRPLEDVRALLEAAPPGPFDFGADQPFRLDQAVGAYCLADRDQAAAIAATGIAASIRQGATPLVHRLRVVEAAAREDGDALRGAIADAAETGELGLLVTAEVIAPELHLLDLRPPALEQSIRAWPGRWLPLLRRVVMTQSGAPALAAARALDEFGVAGDVPLLRAFDRRLPKRDRPGLGRVLARRVSPRLEIRDLGQTWIVCGDRRRAATEIRRRAAALLLYLASRGASPAHREQVLEDLWPEGEPESSMNNLNQTLYFLRRDIERWYEEGVSVDYVRFEGDLLWLDDELVWSASGAFDRATRGRTVPDPLESALHTFALYEGRFAPEFAYDDWSNAWREHLHARYLSLAQDLVLRLSATGDFSAAQRVARAAVACDPDALELERELVWLYGRTGHRAAAAEQYRHYAAKVREHLGLEVETLAELLRSDAGSAL